MTNAPNPPAEDRKARNQRVIDEFHANAGRVSGRYEQSAIALLHTKGAKSGQERINPVASLAEGDVLYVFASKGGGPNNPDWYHNIVADPDITVEYGSEVFEAKATVLTGPERDRIFAQQAAKAPQFGDYQKNTTRIIPVIALHRKG